jgi:hypothetical protein
MRIPPAIYVGNPNDFDRLFIPTCPGTKTPQVTDQHTAPTYPADEMPTVRNLNGPATKSHISSPIPTPRADPLSSTRYRQKTSVCEKALTIAAAFALAVFCSAANNYIYCQTRQGP